MKYTQNAIITPTGKIVIESEELTVGLKTFTLMVFTKTITGRGGQLDTAFGANTATIESDNATMLECDKNGMYRGPFTGQFGQLSMQLGGNGQSNEIIGCITGSFNVTSPGTVCFEMQVDGATDDDSIVSSIMLYVA